MTSSGSWKTEIWLEKASRGAFKLIPKLPTELRLVIWKLAMPASRVIALQYGFDERIFAQSVKDGNRDPSDEIVKRSQHADDPSKYKLCVHQSPPNILGACQESRTEVLRSLNGRLDPKGQDRPRPTPINFDDDTLHDPNSSDKCSELMEDFFNEPRFTAEVLESIKHIAVDWQDFLYLESCLDKNSLC